jgi:uncharacterized surface protein with fasciclin (FAS1) repeats
MPANCCLSLLGRLTTLLGLASLAAMSSLPAAAQLKVTSGGGIELTATNNQTQQPLRATPSLNLVAQVGVSSIADELSTASDAFSTLRTAIRVAGLVEELARKGPFTVFAPTDEAFEALPSGTVETLLKPENKARLKRILTYHVVPGNINTFGLRPGTVTRLTTLAGKPLTVRVTDTSDVFVNGNRVIMADIPATNGTIHGISGVLLP